MQSKSTLLVDSHEDSAIMTLFTRNECTREHTIESFVRKFGSRFYRGNLDANSDATRTACFKIVGVEVGTGPLRLFGPTSEVEKRNSLSE